MTTPVRNENKYPDLHGILKTDSQGAYNLAKIAKFLWRIRHIQHRYHDIRQEVQQENLKVLTSRKDSDPELKRIVINHGTPIGPCWWDRMLE